MEEKTIATATGKRPNKGIPSADAFYLPRKDSLDELLGKQGAIRTATPWLLGDVLQFVFPQKHREKYYLTAVLLLTALQENKGKLYSDQVIDLVKKTGVSKATFYNKVIPRLVRVGMIERNRTPGQRKLTLTWSNQFALYLEKIAFEWKRLEPR